MQRAVKTTVLGFLFAVSGCGVGTGTPNGAAITILNGEDEMPAFSSKLSNQDVADILAYLKTL